MTSGPLPQCALCVHLQMDPEQTCAAFPAGIPGEIWRNEADHRLAYPDDNGIRWESLDGAGFPRSMGEPAAVLYETQEEAGADG